VCRIKFLFKLLSRAWRGVPGLTGGDAASSCAAGGPKDRSPGFRPGRIWFGCDHMPLMNLKTGVVGHMGARCRWIGVCTDHDTPGSGAWSKVWVTSSSCVIFCHSYSCDV